MKPSAGSDDSLVDERWFLGSSFDEKIVQQFMPQRELEHIPRDASTRRVRSGPCRTPSTLLERMR